MRRKNVNLSKVQPRLAKAWAMGQRRRLRQSLAGSRLLAKLSEVKA